MNDFKDAVTRIEHAVNGTYLQHIQKARFVLEDELGADIEISMTDIRALLAALEIKRGEVKEFHEYLREDHNAQAFRGWQILKAKVQALKGGA